VGWGCWAWQVSTCRDDGMPGTPAGQRKLVAIPLAFLFSSAQAPSFLSSHFLGMS
jgi:hypothetical protein